MGEGQEPISFVLDLCPIKGNHVYDVIMHQEAYKKVSKYSRLSQIEMSKKSL